MKFDSIIEKARYMYLEYVQARIRKPKYATMNRNTLEDLKKEIESFYFMTVFTNNHNRIFGVKISICDEVADGVIDFVG